MTLSDFISTVLVLVGKGRWAELGAYLAVIQEWQRTNPTGNQLSDLTEVKAGIKNLHDLIIAHQEIIMAGQTEMNAALDELGVAITSELEQLKTALAGGGMTSDQVDAALLRLRTAVDSLKADD